MADPITAIVGGVGLASSVAGGFFGAQGAEYQAQAQANQAQYQAGVARINAQIQKQNADYAIAAGEVEAQQAGIGTRQTVGAERAAFGAGNIDVNSGSAAQVQASEIAVGQENQSIIRANAARRAYGATVEGAMDTAQAGVYDVARTTALEAGDIGAVSSILGAAGSVSTKWLQGRNLGMFGPSVSSTVVS
jgi:hypothetical protein